MNRILTDLEQKALLKVARETIVSFVRDRITPEYSFDSEAMNARNGCFVTIHQHDALRGCIGNFVSQIPLYRLVQEMAIAASSDDPRFLPMREGDLQDFDLEISVLSPLKKIDSIDEIEVGRDGIYIIKGVHRGVLLPQVAVEYGWNREEFLRHTCRKAGLPDDAYKSGCEILIFSAEIFNEKGN